MGRFQREKRNRDNKSRRWSENRERDDFRERKIDSDDDDDLDDRYLMELGERAIQRLRQIKEQ